VVCSTHQTAGPSDDHLRKHPVIEGNGICPVGRAPPTQKWSVDLPIIGRDQKGRDRL
jgi:hypothetical protein